MVWEEAGLVVHEYGKQAGLVILKKGHVFIVMIKDEEMR